MVHRPVLLQEVLRYLDVRPGKHYVDATADGGGHAIALIKAIAPTGKLLALEWDEELFRVLRRHLAIECSRFSKNYVLRRSSYTQLEPIVRSLGFGPIAGVLFDLGMSSFHLEASRRGFSFQRDEPLDMRYAGEILETAAQLLARRSERELAAILTSFGEERFALRIARGIVVARRERPIRRTSELVEVIRRSVPGWYRRSRIHFATRTFQALRIAVNRELENLAVGLGAAAAVLAPGGRILTIAFHSLEDRIVKAFFRHDGAGGAFRTLLKHPARPSPNECALNPRSRSARLRAFEKQP